MEDPFLDPNVSYNRIVADYLKYGSITVAFDFDSTVHDFHKEGHTYPKVIKLLQDLAAINCKLVCWTCYPDLSYVIDYLKKVEIPIEGINSDGIKLPWASRKPFFSALLDDRSGLYQVYTELRNLVDFIRRTKPEIESKNKIKNAN